MKKTKIKKLPNKVVHRHGIDSNTRIVENSYDDVLYHIGQVKWFFEEIEFYLKESFRKVFPDLIIGFTWECKTIWKNGEKISLSREETLRKLTLSPLFRHIFGRINEKNGQKIKGYLEPSTEFADLVEDVIDARNWFTHNFQEDTARQSISTVEGRKTLIALLQHHLMILYEMKQFMQALLIYWKRSKNEDPTPLGDNMYEDMLINYLTKIPEAFGFQSLNSGATPIRST